LASVIGLTVSCEALVSACVRFAKFTHALYQIKNSAYLRHRHQQTEYYARNATSLKR